MILGQRVVWLVPGKTGRVTAINKLKRTVDLVFEDDGSARGDVPLTEVVSVSQSAEADLPVIGQPPKPRPPGVRSQEDFGRPSLG
jgi:hypothetical protein